MSRVVRPRAPTAAVTIVLALLIVVGFSARSPPSRRAASRRAFRRRACGSRSEAARSVVLDRPATGEERGAVLLVHGASGNVGRHVVALGDRLAEAGFRVLSVDRPGPRLERPRSAAATAPRRPFRRRRCASAAEERGVARGGGRRPFARRARGPRAGARPARFRPGARPDCAGQPPVARRRRLVLRRSARTAGSGRRSAGSSLCRPGCCGCARPSRGCLRPTRPPPNFIEATGVPLVLRPLHFRANCEDVAHAKAAVTALSPRYGAIRAPTEVVTGDSRRRRLRPYPLGRVGEGHSRRAADDAERASATRPITSRRIGSSRSSCAAERRAAERETENA